MVTNLGGCNGRSVHTREGFFFQTKQFENVPVKWPARRIKKINVHTSYQTKAHERTKRKVKKTETMVKYNPEPFSLKS